MIFYYLPVAVTDRFFHLPFCLSVSISVSMLVSLCVGLSFCQFCVCLFDTVMPCCSLCSEKDCLKASNLKHVASGVTTLKMPAEVMKSGLPLAPVLGKFSNSRWPIRQTDQFLLSLSDFWLAPIDVSRVDSTSIIFVKYQFEALCAFEVVQALNFKMVRNIFLFSWVSTQTFYTRNKYNNNTQVHEISTVQRLLIFGKILARYIVIHS